MILFYSTVYHPQSNGQSKQINQTVEIALRFILATFENFADWKIVIGPIQSAVNNFWSTLITKSPNKIVYGFTLTHNINLILSSTINKQPLLPPKFIKIEVADVIAFAQIAFKIYNDKKHRDVSFRERDCAFLRLYYGYKIPLSHILGPKLSQQFANPFKIHPKVGNLAYYLEILTHGQIYLVFTIV